MVCVCIHNYIYILNIYSTSMKIFRFHTENCLGGFYMFRGDGPLKHHTQVRGSTIFFWSVFKTRVSWYLLLLTSLSLPLYLPSHLLFLLSLSLATPFSHHVFSWHVFSTYWKQMDTARAMCCATITFQAQSEHDPNCRTKQAPYIDASSMQRLTFTAKKKQCLVRSLPLTQPTRTY